MSSSTSFGSGAMGTSALGSVPFSDAKDLIDQVLRATGHANPADETTKRAQILVFLNNRYQQVCIGTYWRWMKAQYGFNLNAPYTTGTVSTVKGDETVTGTGTVFSSNLTPKNLFWLTGQNVPYYISSVTDATSLELETKYSEDSATDSTYTAVQNQYKMPKEVDQLLAINVNGTTKVEIIGPDDLSLMMSRDPVRTGIPRYAAFVRRDTDDDSTYIQFYPAPDKMYQVELQYTVRIYSLDDVEDCTPILPDRYRSVLFYGAAGDFATMVLKNPAVGDRMTQMFNQIYMMMKNDKALVDQDLRVQPAVNYRKKATRGRQQGFWGVDYFGKVDT